MARITSIKPVENSGLSPEVSGEIFDQISLFAGYGFNKSHAAAYAAIAFRTAWLKTHHPEAFFAAAMNLDLDEVDKIAIFAAELKSRQIHIWAPSINASRAIFTPIRLKKTWRGRDYALAYGLSAIRGVGRSVADAIVAERQAKGAFASVQDFTTRMGKTVNNQVLKALAKAGAFDCTGATRSEALAIIAGRDTRADARQVSLFDLMDDAAPQVDVEEMSRDEELDAEFDVLGHYMTGHPLEWLKPQLQDKRLDFSRYVLEEASDRMRKAHLAGVITNIDVRRTRSGDIMAVLAVSDPEGCYEALVFGETWTAISSSVAKKARVVLECEISQRGDERRLIVDNVRGIPKPAGTKSRNAAKVAA